MINRKKILACTLTGVLSINIVTANFSFAQTATITQSYETVNSLDLVKNPKIYLNKKIKVKATFDKFSSLGLDYQGAYRDSKKYISFLIRRPNLGPKNVIPLSELKLLIKRDKAEKLTDLESGDKIEFSGKVFSSALNDPWVDVEEVKVLSSKKKKENK